MRAFNILEKYILMLLYADNQKPITSLKHLENMLLLCAKNNSELEQYLSESGEEEE